MAVLHARLPSRLMLIRLKNVGAVLPLALALLTFSRGVFAQNTAEKILVGDTKVTVVAEYKGTEKLAAPTLIVLHDFDVPSEIITVDHSPLAHMPHVPILHKKSDGDDTSPSTIADKVQMAFTKDLMANLKKSSIPVTVSPLGANPETAAGTLIIRGDFTTVKQGNKTARVMIGLGRGASDVQAHVVITLITADSPILLSEFNVNAASSKKPGAVETMGVGVAASAAADTAVDGKATVEGDTSRIAKAVAKALTNIMIARQWMSAPAAANTQNAFAPK
jgi:hypothetical protein